MTGEEAWTGELLTTSGPCQAQREGWPPEAPGSLKGTGAAATLAALAAGAELLVSQEKLEIQIFFFCDIQVLKVGK